MLSTPSVVRAEEARRRQWAPWLITIGFLLMQIAWIITVPPFRGSDEFDHAYRAAGVASGQWVAREPAQDGRGLLVRVPSDLVEAAHAQCSALPYTGHDNCNAVRSAGDGEMFVASGAGSYQPVYYWIVGTVSEPLHGTARLYAMRVATAVLCALLFAGAAWSAGRCRTRWPSLGLVVATTPVLVYSTSIVAPNGLELCAALGLWTSLLGLGAEKGANDRALWAIATVSGFVLAGLRLLGPAFVLAIVVAVLLFDHAGLRRMVREHRWWVLGTVVLAVSSAGFLRWWMSDPGSAGVADQDENGRVKALHGLLWAMQSIAAFPYRDQLGSLLVYPLVGTVVVVLVWAAVRSAPRRQGLMVLLAMVGALALPFVAAAVSGPGRGTLWQGRYGLPLGVGFVLLAGYALARGGPRPTNHPAIHAPVAAITVTALSLGVAACLLKVRHEELTHNPASLHGWWAPWPALLVALVLASSLATFLALSGGEAPAEDGARETQ